MTRALLAIDRLTIEFATRQGEIRALDQFGCDIAAGEVLALVGESGSGKTTVGLSILGLLGPEAMIRSGRIDLDGENLLDLPEERYRRIRGDKASIVFQDPFTSLNPSLPVGLQVAEPLLVHRQLGAGEAEARVMEVLGEVGLPDPEAVARSYPHQLSGGMRQRVLIATAIVCDPDLLILDEPTTALDVTVEARILDLLDDIRNRRRLGILFITHNLSVVHRFADRVCVLYAGRVVETGTKPQVLGSPAHPYTKGLLASIPRLSARHRRLEPIPGRLPDLTDPPPGCIFQPRCPFAEERCSEPQALEHVDEQKARCWKARHLLGKPWKVEGVAAKQRPPPRQPERQPLVSARDLHKSYALGGALPQLDWRRLGGILPWPRVKRHRVQALDGVTLDIAGGEVLGLVGESGSGKTTLGRAVLRLIAVDGGEIRFRGEDVTKLAPRELKDFRRQAQIVFQNPDSSLNPRRTVGDAVARAAALFSDLRGSALRSRVEHLLARVGLSGTFYDRYPHQLSGGEKQRIGIARALATEPSFLVCDEPVSALDVSVQATVLNLLSDLRAEYGLAYLFVSHDLSVVAHVSDRIAVMYAGRIVESGATGDVLSPPFHPYTEALFSAVSDPDPKADQPTRIVLRSEGGPGRTGCPFHTRCPRKIGEICENTAPPIIEPKAGHHIVCHLGSEVYENWAEQGRPSLASARP